MYALIMCNYMYMYIHISEDICTYMYASAYIYIYTYIYIFAHFAHLGHRVACWTQPVLGCRTVQKQPKKRLIKVETE